MRALVHLSFHCASNSKLKVTNYGAIYGTTLDGQFEASLMLLDDLWDDTLAELTPNGARPSVRSCNPA